MEEGYSKTPIGKKLGFHQGFNILLHNPPDHYFDFFEDFPDQAVLLKTCKSDYADVIHIFCKKLEELAQVLPEHIKALKKTEPYGSAGPKGPLNCLLTSTGTSSGSMCSEQDWWMLKWQRSIKTGAG